MLDPALACAGVPGAAGAISRSSGRAHRLGAADPRCLVSPGRAAAGRGEPAHRRGPGRAAGLRTGEGLAALRAIAAAQLSQAGQLQVATALDMLQVLDSHLDTVRRRLLDAAAHLTGAKVPAARLYGVGPITALALTCWLGGGGRFSAARKAVRFAGAGCDRVLIGRQALTQHQRSGPGPASRHCRGVSGRLLAR
jgi:hypothetical protein